MAIAVAAAAKKINKKSSSKRETEQYPIANATILAYES